MHDETLVRSSDLAQALAERDALRLRLAEVERELLATSAVADRQRDRAKCAERAVEDVTRERDAAVAAERERCAEWVWQASAAADENVIGDEDVAAWAIERIKSGAPAPREG